MPWVKWPLLSFTQRASTGQHEACSELWVEARDAQVMTRVEPASQCPVLPHDASLHALLQLNMIYILLILEHFKKEILKHVLCLICNFNLVLSLLD